MGLGQKKKHGAVNWVAGQVPLQYLVEFAPQNGSAQVRRCYGQ